MYNTTQLSLGQVPTQPSLMDKFFGVVQSGLNTGFNIYSKIRELQQAQKARKMVEEQARLTQQISYSVPPAGESQINWTTVGMVGLGGVLLIALMKK